MANQLDNTTMPYNPINILLPRYHGITTYLDMARPVLAMCHKPEKEMIYATLLNLGKVTLLVIHKVG